MVKRGLEILAMVSVLATASAVAQTQQTAVAPPTASSASTVVPHLIKFSGTLVDEQGRPVKGPVGVTFSLNAQQSGGAALWMETQNVKPDASGDYTVLLGGAGANGIPEELFASGEARWLGVQAEGQAEQPRVLLVSVPYALKAGDAQTLGGLPASAFLTASSQNAKAPAPVSALVVTTPLVAQPSSIMAAPTGSGTANTIPLWTSSSNLGNSNITQISGIVSVKDTLQLPATGTATALAGNNSQPFDLLASSFNKTLATGINQHFRWQAEPVGNNTTAPSGKLNLLYAAGAATPAETGLSISNKGLFSFASGQTFPGTGTVTRVGLSAPSADFKVSGSPVTKSGTLALSWNVPPTNADKANAIVKRDSAGSFHAAQIFGDLGVEGITALTCSGCAGVSGVNTGGGLGVQGLTAGDAPAVLGQNSSTSGGIADGVHGVTNSASASGVAGVNNSGLFGGVGVFGTGSTGIFGTTTTGTVGVNGIDGSTSGFGAANVGVWGDTGFSNATGVLGTANDGVGVFAETNSGTDTVTPTLKAVNFSSTAGALVFEAQGGSASTGGTCVIDVNGNLACSGAVTSNGNKPFKIDDPADPAGKYLVHVAVESSEMINIYTGNAVLDSSGAATVRLPSWFQTENADFRYALAAIGGPAPNLYIAEEVRNNHFKIAGGQPGQKVSWQITAPRQDAWAKANPLQPEVEKPENERGFYVHPELFGQPKEKSVYWRNRASLPKSLERKPEKQTEPQQVTKPPAAETLRSPETK